MKLLFTHCLMLCFACLHLTTLAQSPNLIKTNKRCTIPIKLTAYNNIVAEAVLNSTDTLHLMLHTASADLILTDEAIARLKSLHFNGKVASVKSWGGNANSSGFSRGNSLGMGKLSWKNVLVWEDKNSGQESDGKFGLNLFKDQVIELDFDKNLLTVETKMPRNLKGYDKLRLSFKNNNLFIEAVCQVGKDTLRNQYLIHSGYAGTVLLDDHFSSQHHLGEQLQITGEQKLSDAYGNVFTTKKAIVPAFAIGNVVLNNMPVSFWEGTLGRQKISVIGGGILKRFNWIIDAKREYIYLKPNRFYKLGYTNS